MNKYNETFGIDISKAVFDWYGSKQGHLQFKNDETGFKKFQEILPINSSVVMEATGYYHYRFAQFLYKKKVIISVENHLSVRRFIQMKLSKIKTDKSDSKMICKYAESVELRLWEGQSKEHQECLQMVRILSVYK